MNLTCQTIFDRHSGDIHDAEHLLSQLPEDKLFNLRRDVELSKQFACPLCMRTLKLRGGRSVEGKTLHFAHPRDPEHQCPYKSEHSLAPEVIARMVYNGAKESRKHRLMKVWLWRSLRADSDVDPSTVQIERRFPAHLPDSSYRRPDVSAVWRDQKFVFEAQVTSTFVSVIAQRVDFYRKEGAKLLWLFSHWPQNTDRFIHKDLYYNNNYNVLVVNESTSAASIAAGRFLLDVWWPNVEAIDADGRASKWESKRIGLIDLQFDELHGGRAFYVDVDKLLERHRAAFPPLPDDGGGHSALQESDTVPFSLDDEVKMLSLYKNLPLALREERIDLDDAFRIALSNESNWANFAKAAVGAGLLSSPYDHENNRRIGFALMTSLEALKTGKCEAPWKNLSEIETSVYFYCPKVYGLFLLAVHDYDRGEALRAYDSNSTFQAHVREYKVSAWRGQQERAFDALVLLLFPRLANAIKTLQARHYRNTRT